MYFRLGLRYYTCPKNIFMSTENDLLWTRDKKKQKK